MNVLILAVGRLKEKYWQQAAAEYEKRLGRYGRIEIQEIPDLPEPAKASAAEEEQIKRQEGEALLRRIRPEDIVIAMCIDGERPDSPALSRMLSAYYDKGRRVVFVIGGSLGLSPAVVARAQKRLSFSPLTFPHQLARIMLLEQIYRGCKIASGEKYHK